MTRSGFQYVFEYHNTLCAAGLTLDGRALFATGGEATGVPIWDPATGDVVRVLDHRGSAGVIATGQVDGRTLLAIGGPSLTAVWDPAAGTEIASLRTDGSPTPTAITFGTAGGRDVAVTGGSTHVDFWEPLTGRHVRRLPGHQRGSGLAAGPNVLAAVRDEEICLWDLDTGERRWTATGPDGLLTCLASVDSGRFVSGARDGTVRLWDFASGEPLATLATFARPVQAVAATTIDGARHVYALATSGRLVASRL